MAPRCDPYTGGDPLPQLVYERQPGAARRPLPADSYQPLRHPENTPLYRTVYHGLEPFLDEAARCGTSYPAFIEKELRKLLGCNILGRGFARVVCPRCKKEHLLAFRCKSRACPSCWNRRAADFAATTVDQVLPLLPYRQFVLSFPWDMRLALAFNPAFLTKVFRSFVRAVFCWYRLRARRLGGTGGTPGAILMIQRQGSAINLNPHGHLVVTDGTFVPDPQRPQRPLDFEPLGPPTDEELGALLGRITERSLALWRKYCPEDERCLDPDEQLLAQAMAEAVRPPIAATSSQGLEPAPPPQGQARQRLCVQKDGFSLHARRQIQPPDRKGLEQLLRYGARPPIAASRLSVDDHGQLLYELTKPWGVTGVTVLRLSPNDLLRRLAMLIPPPYQNLIRYFGVFASRSKLRPLLPPPPTPPGQQEAPQVQAAATTPSDDQGQGQRQDDEHDRGQDDEHDREQDAEPGPPQRTYRLPWAQLMKRVIGIDPLVCKRCATPMVILAFISDIAVVHKILNHLKIPTEVAVAPLSHGPCPGQSSLDVDELGPEFDPAAQPSSLLSPSQSVIGVGRGPPTP